MGSLTAFIKGLNNINLITAMIEENKFKFADKEMGFVMTSLILSLFSTLGNLVFLILNNF